MTRIFRLPVLAVKAGMTVELDGGFTCIGAGKVTLLDDNDGYGPYFMCRAGKHCLEGQLSYDGTCYVGLLPVEKSNDSI